jgi:hypothetical protein
MSHRRIGEVVLCEFSISLIFAIAMSAGLNAEAAQPDLDKLVGQPAGSWWNNLRAVQKTVKPAVSAGGRTYATA